MSGREQVGLVGLALVLGGTVLGMRAARPLTWTEPAAALADEWVALVVLALGLALVGVAWPDWWWWRSRRRRE